MPIYKADASEPPLLGYQDIDEALKWIFDWSAEMTAIGTTIAASVWTLPTGANAGDGVATFASKGGTVTPVVSSIIDTNTRTLVHLYFDALGTYIIENSITTADDQALSRSGRIVVVKK